MTISFSLLLCLVVWVVIFVLVIRRCFKRNMPSIGLPIAFLFAFALDYWFGALIHSLPWYRSYESGFVLFGFLRSTYAVIAFAFGSLILAPFLIRTFRLPWLKGKFYTPSPKLPMIYLAIGFLFYFTLRPLLTGFTSIRTLSYTSWNLLVASVCLGCWNMWHLRKKEGLIFWLMVAGILPFFTTIESGFLGVGTIALMTILCFVGVFYRPKFVVIIGMLLVSYLGLSFFVNYMGYRDEIRDAIWEERQPTHKRVNIVLDMLRNFEFIDLYDQDHLDQIETRLNQNHLVGAAIDNMESGYEPYARGETIFNSVLAMIPRIIWPEKPITVSDAGLITRYTGLEFGDETMVTMGLVMEFYVNFGTIGIIIGFVIFGVIMAMVDITCGYKLSHGDWQGFTYWFLPAISLIASTSLVQITMTAAASLVLCVLVNRFILPFIGIKRVSR